MPNFNKSILIEKINALMAKKNISQKKLAEILGMSQPNVSKALNPNEKKCFTLAQIYDLAIHFHLSIDELVGNGINIKASISPRATASYITKLVENHDIEFIPFSRTEHVFNPRWDNGYPNAIEEDQVVDYPAIIFPSYWNPKDAKSDEDWYQLREEAIQVGNDTSMLPVNNYLKRFQEIFKIYENGDLSKETYETVINDLLSHLKE